ncbi:hypothetical protein ILUMI_15570 [Ignelater luminosus]|uniref:Uncharacterized protein n=1 Tax=Ignelater luminosus TaxID=2038154 RepID=A0A8K0CNC3_IGNLU|nr:hypothetical protein ILUMI_15570 [Ignelater luminosus]
MSSDKVKRGTLKSKLTTFTKFVSEVRRKNEITDLDFIQLQERLSKIETLLDEFDEIQCQNESASEAVGDELHEREEFENNFFTQISIAKKNHKRQ